MDLVALLKCTNIYEFSTIRLELKITAAITVISGRVYCTIYVSHSGIKKRTTKAILERKNTYSLIYLGYNCPKYIVQREYT